VAGVRVILAGLKRLCNQPLMSSEDAQMAWIRFCIRLSSATPQSAPIFEPAFLMEQLLMPLLPLYPWMALSCIEAMLSHHKAIRIRFRQPVIVKPVPVETGE